MTAVTKVLGSTLLALSLASAAEAGPTLRCPSEAEKLVGQRPVVIDKNVQPPRKLQNAAVDFSTMGESRKGSGMWLGEALIDKDGKISQVWTIRSPRFEPAWPEFEDVVAKTLRQWVYEPTVVDGTPAPVCIVVSLNIHWS